MNISQHLHDMTRGQMLAGLVIAARMAQIESQAVRDTDHSAAHSVAFSRRPRPTLKFIGSGS